jgi:integrase
MNLSLAKVYLRHNDPLVASRTWQMVIDEIIRTKTGENQIRWQVMAKSKWFDPLRHRLLIETQAEHLLHVLQCGKVAINVYLRRMHNFAIDMNWLPASVLPKRQWPPVKFKDKRAITVEEHQKIIAAERNPERKVFYQLCWHLGASQGDIANLKGEDVDWQNGTISFVRRKTGVPVLVHLGSEALNVFKDLPAEGVLFSYLSRVRQTTGRLNLDHAAGSLALTVCRCTATATRGRTGRKLPVIQSGSRRRHSVTKARRCIVLMRNGL